MYKKLKQTKKSSAWTSYDNLEMDQIEATTDKSNAY